MSKNVLVIDQSRTIQTLLSMAFMNAGHNVLACPTSQEASKAVASISDAPDVVFFSLTATEQNDYQMIHHMKEHAKYKHTMLVVMVPQEDKASIQHILKDTIVHYLIKPFQIQDALVFVSPSVPVVESERRT